MIQPAVQIPATALVQVDDAERYRVRIDASDSGTDAWAALTYRYFVDPGGLRKD
jgi:hypothetical protein